MSDVPLGNLFMKLIADTKSFEKMLGTANKALKSTEKSMGLVATANARLQSGFKMMGGFGDALLGMASKADKVGTKLTNLVTIPIAAFAAYGIKSFLDLAGANSAVAREVEQLSAEALALKREFTAMAVEVGKALLPYLILAIRWVRVGINVWKGFSDETKRYVGIAIAVLAILGPLLKIFAFLATVVGGLVSVVSAVGAVMFGWVGIIAVVILGLIMLTDAILQMTNQGNLGVLDLINSFRIGGSKISTWMTAAWLVIFKGFENMKYGILLGWEVMKAKASDVANLLRTKWLRVYKDIIQAYTRFLDFITDGDMGVLDQMVNAIGISFDQMINESLNDAERAQQSYYDSIGKMASAHLQEQQKYSDSIAELFKADAAAAASNDGPLDRLKAIYEQAKKLLNNPDIAAARSNRTSRVAAQGAFETVALNRMSIASPGGLTRKEKSSVEDVGSHSRLDTLINITRGQRATTLG